MVVGCALPPRNSYFTHPSIRNDYISPTKSAEATLRVAEPVQTVKMLKKNLN